MVNGEPTRRRILQVSGAALASTAGIAGTVAADHNCSSADQCDAYITFNDQQVHASADCANDCAVTVAEANLPCGGFIDIHDPDLEDGTYPAGKGIGATCYLPAGSYLDVEICLFEGNCAFGDCISWDRNCIQKEQQLDAMLHLDTDHDEEFTHYCDHTAGVDVAYKCNDKPVKDSAIVSP